MVKWVMVGWDAFKAAEADVPGSQRVKPEAESSAGHEQRLET